MKLKYVGIVSLFFILLIPIPHVGAQNTQGLYWGVTEDTRIDYHFVSRLPEYNVVSTTTLYTEVAYDYYLVVVSLPELPEYVVYPFTALPPFALSYYFSNGTSISPTMGLFSLPSIYPIGNWTFYTNYILGLSPSELEIEIIDDFSVWGYTMFYEIGEEGLVTAA